MTCPACSAENEPRAKACFACGAPLDAATPTFTEGLIFAERYSVQAPIGRGGMGMVYRARDLQRDGVVALKIVRPDIARESDRAFRRFQSEITLARRVRHPNVCAIYDDGIDHGLPYIVMEFVDGVDLRQLIRGAGGLAPAEAYAVALQVADGLQAIHEAGIIHRDLKTPNVMIDGRGVVRLMDFGIAKESRKDLTTSATDTGHFVGTPEYMSPEQIRGERLDHRSDIYSLGIVVFETFTGELPFRGDTPVATIFKHLQEPVRFETRGAVMPEPARPVVQKALAKERSERFATALEMREALRQSAEAGGVVPASVPRPAVRPGPRAPLGAAGALTMTVSGDSPQPPTGEKGAAGAAQRRAVLAYYAIGAGILAVSGALLQQQRSSAPHRPDAMAPRPSLALASPPGTLMAEASDTSAALSAPATTAPVPPEIRRPPIAASPRPPVRAIEPSPTPPPSAPGPAPRSTAGAAEMSVRGGFTLTPGTSRVIPGEIREVNGMPMGIARFPGRIEFEPSHAQPRPGDTLVVRVFATYTGDMPARIQLVSIATLRDGHVTKVSKRPSGDGVLQPGQRMLVDEVTATWVEAEAWKMDVELLVEADRWARSLTMTVGRP